MKTKKDKKNKSGLTKSGPRFLSGKLSKYFALLTLLGLLKLGLLGSLLQFDSDLQKDSGMMTTGQRTEQSSLDASQKIKVLGAKEALAAQGADNASSAESKEQELEGKGDLAEEWKALKEERTQLRRKEESLKELEKRIDQKLAKEKELKNKLENLLEEVKAVKTDKIKHLVDVYSNMEPKQAAKVLETISEDIAVKVLAGMRGRTAGEILSFVQAEKAARLSEALTDFQTPFEN